MSPEVTGGGTPPAQSADTPERQRIVIVDDDPGVLGALDRFVKVLGHESVPFSDFDHARTFMMANAFDALVVDVRLGAFNGLQLVHLARQFQPKARIVAVSGYEDSVLKDDAMSAGAIYLVKPLELSTLRESLALKSDRPQN